MFMLFVLLSFGFVLVSCENPVDSSPETYYTITYNINGGSGTVPAAQTGSSGSVFMLPSGKGLTKTGYDFGGWNTAADGSGTNYAANSAYTVTANITLYARWDDYTVTFDINDGNGTPPSAQKVSSGSVITLPTGDGFSKIGFTFEGWNTNRYGTGTNYQSGYSYTVNRSTTLYAKWEVDLLNTSLANKLTWLQINAVSGGSYTLEVKEDESIAPHTLSYGNRNDITIILKGIDVNRTVSLSSNGSMFTVGNGNTLILDENITLQGNDDNDKPLVLVSRGGTLVMNNGSTITGNTSTTYGGGVYVEGNSSFPGSFTMNGGEISGNTARYGGGVYVSDSGTFTMSSGKISGNNSTSPGGGVYVRGTFIMESGEISGNTSISYFGGGVCVFGTFTMESGEISGNTSSSSGGGVYVSSDGTFTMFSGKITGNTAASSSGGVHMSGTFIMTGGEITGNTATSSSGGVRVSGTFIMTGGEISHNSVTDDDSSGGGVAVFSNGTFTMENGKITGNTAASSSGGVHVSGTFIMTGGEISHNNVTNDDSSGGGMRVSGSGTFTMNGGEIFGNTASSGGGMYIFGTIIMNDGKIYGNTATTSSGGGVRVSSNGTFTMNGGEISGNNSSTFGGGVHVFSTGTFTMSGGEIFSNIASESGGGVYVSRSGIFDKTSGTITGYTSNPVNGNAVKDSSGDIINDRGHAVYVYTSLNSNMRKEYTAGQEVNLSFNGTTDPQTFSGGWDY